MLSYSVHQSSYLTMSKERFQLFLEEFGLPQSVVEKLWNGNVRSIKQLASSETSAIRGLVDHPVLQTILPILQQHSAEISMADEPHRYALGLLHRLAEDEDEVKSSTNNTGGHDEIPMMDETSSTSTFGETVPRKWINEHLKNDQELWTKHENIMLEEDTLPGQRLEHKDEDYEAGDTLRHGNKISANISGGNLFHPNIGGTTIYNKDNIVIENAQIHLTKIYASAHPESQSTPSFNESKEFDSLQHLKVHEEKTEGQSDQAIKKLKAVIRELNRPNLDVDLSKFSITSDQLPEVYPEIYSVDFYEGKLVPNDDKYYPKCNALEIVKTDEKRTFQEFISNFQTQTFISLIGHPGAGKSTLSKRLTRQLTHVDDFVVFRFLFMNMANADNEKLTLKEFLLGDVNLNLNENEKNAAFQWIRCHPDKCFFIFDGFDQVSWNIKDDLKINPQYDRPYSPQELVSMLCHGQFLQTCHIIFTSRPHAMLHIPKRCRPKQTYVLRDLALDDMEKLFYALVNDQQKADELWLALRTKSPQLELICHNPLMLHLYISASLSSSDDVGLITTVTKVFQKVLQNFSSSDHAVCLTNQIVARLAKIAYKATAKGTVLITTDDLKSEALTSEQVQDLVVTLWGEKKNSELLVGGQRLYFNHQTFQEYFAALYLCYEMPLQNFATFLQEHLSSGHWSVVVNFLSGILLNQDMNDDEQSETKTGLLSKLLFRKKDKKDIFLSSLTKETKFIARDAMETYSGIKSIYETIAKELQASASLNERTKKKGKKLGNKKQLVAQNTLSICKILHESSNEEVIKTTASSFAGGCILLSQNHLTASDLHALACVIKTIPVRVQVLSLFGCRIESESFAILREALKEMPGKIAELDIRRNDLSGVHDVIPVLHKIEKKVRMEKCFDRRSGELGVDEKNTLQQALDRQSNTELKISYQQAFQTRTLHHKNSIKERLGQVVSNVIH